MAINPVLVIGDIIQATIGCNAPDFQVGENVLHYVVTTAIGGVVGMQDAADALYNYFDVNYPPLLFNGASFAGCKAQRIFPLPVSVTARSTGAAVPGTAGAEPLPEQISGLVHKATTQGGRSGRGRAYIPFPSTADNATVGGQTAGYLTRLGLLATDMLTPIGLVVGGGSAVLTPCLWKRKLPLVFANATFLAAVYPVTGWATQRRRGVFGRTNPPF